MKLKSITWKSIFLGLLLIPINIYWIVRSETTGQIFYSTTSSLFCSVIFIVFLLALFNQVTKRWFRLHALAQGELLVIYSVLSVTTAMSGESVGQQLVRIMGTPFWYATSENEWAALFHRYLPPWLIVANKPILQAFFEGDRGDPSLLYTVPHFMIWFQPLLMWSLFVFLIVSIMTCINVIVRKQWIEQEKLTYPIIQLPLGLTTEDNSLLDNRKMWIGFSIGAGITLLNGFHYLFPIVPGINNINDISGLFSTHPWDVVRPMVIAFYPCAIGLAFLMPLDLSMSTWFFFFFWKAQLILGAVFGLRSLPGFPYARWQQTGAYLAIGILALWISRRQIGHVFNAAWKSVPPASSRLSEPMSYRIAILGLVGGFSLLALFGMQMGMTSWVALSFFSFYFILSIAITRMRAELGPLVHELYYSNVGQAMTAVLGTRRIPPSSLTAVSLLWWLTRSQNSHVMPHQLETFKLAERTGVDAHRWWVFMLVASVLGGLICSYAVLDAGYHNGGDAGFAPETYRRLQGWLYNPRPANLPASVFMGIGFLFALLLLWLKQRFLWWPFHPLGYAVTQGDWAITFIWFPIFTSWLLKLLILKYAGIRAHRNAIPIFLGL
ncbi:TPA: hypothetical protein EYM26_15350, partial [Candidatus Poribacteria bacterium]|nr:hypothetical protein [Candidatus Poribacteria bacterium]